MLPTSIHVDNKQRGGLPLLLRGSRQPGTWQTPRRPHDSDGPVPVCISQDSGRVLTRTLGEYFSGGDPVSLSQLIIMDLH